MIAKTPSDADLLDEADSYSRPHRDRLLLREDRMGPCD